MTKVSHARKDNPISLTNTIVAKINSIYANQVMISNATIYSAGKILNGTTNNEVTVSKKI